MGAGDGEGMTVRWVLDQLRPELRAQAQRKLDLLRVTQIRTHICDDSAETIPLGGGVRGGGVSPNGSRNRVSGERSDAVEQNSQAMSSGEKSPPLRVSAYSRKRLNRQALIPRLSDPEERLAFHLRAEGLGHFERQYRWCQGKRYRADFAYPKARLLIEVQGGIYIRARRSHTGGDGYEYDRRRNNEAVVLGYRVLEFTTKHVKSGYAVLTIRRALEAFAGSVRNGEA